MSKNKGSYKKRTSTKKKCTRKQYTRKKSTKKRTRGGKSYGPVRNGDKCPNLCLKDGKELSPMILNSITQLKFDREYLYAVRKNDPYQIIFLGNTYPVFNCNDLEHPRYVNHNCLAGDKRILCAGIMELTKDNILRLDNNSGHYQPGDECLKKIVGKILKKLNIAYDLRPFYNTDLSDVSSDDDQSDSDDDSMGSL